MKRFFAGVSLLLMPVLVWAQLSGDVTVGSGGDYTTLTDAVAALNAGGVSGPVRLLLTDALYSTAETFPLIINISTNAPTSTNTVTLKPASGMSPTILGTVNNNCILAIKGTSYVTIDGSNTEGGYSQDLTITNTGTTVPSVLAVASNGTVVLGGVTVKNCVLINGTQGDAENGNAALIAGGPDEVIYFNGLTIQGNDFRKAGYAVFVNGGTSPQRGSNLTVTNNWIANSGADAMHRIGIYVKGVTGAYIAGNEIGNFETTTAEVDIGIHLDQGCVNSTVTENRVYNLGYTGGTESVAAKGIVISSAITNCGITVSNNMVSHIYGTGETLSFSEFGYGMLWTPVGIYAARANSGFGGTGQSGVNIYFNSVHLYENTLNVASAYSVGIGVDYKVSASIVNNIIVNTCGLAGGTGTGAVGVAAMSGASQFTSLDYNNYYCATTSGGNFVGKLGSNDYTTLANFTAATPGKNANSQSVSVEFAANNDLHLTGGSIGNMALRGTPIGGITTDIDGESRSPDPYMGADEAADDPLPVTLASFAAHLAASGGGVHLQWTTISEINNYGFYVERRRSGETAFTGVPGGFVAGQGTTGRNTAYEFVDRTIDGDGDYYYRLRQVDLDGTTHYTESVKVVVVVMDVAEQAPREFALHQNYPNPFNPTTEIRFSVETSGPATVKLYNTVGQVVRTLFDGEAEAGRYVRISVDASGLASGTYMYVLQSGGREIARRMMLLK
jgi:hypothetical protein